MTKHKHDPTTYETWRAHGLLQPEAGKGKKPASFFSGSKARGKGEGGSERWPKKLDQGGERGFEAAKPKKGATQLCAKSSVQSPRYSRLQMFRWTWQCTCYLCIVRTNTGCGGRALEILGRPDKSWTHAVFSPLCTST